MSVYLASFDGDNCLGCDAVVPIGTGYDVLPMIYCNHQCFADVGHTDMDLFLKFYSVDLFYEGGLAGIGHGVLLGVNGDKPLAQAIADVMGYELVPDFCWFCQSCGSKVIQGSHCEYACDDQCVAYSEVSHENQAKEESHGG